MRNQLEENDVEHARFLVDHPEVDYTTHNGRKYMAALLLEIDTLRRQRPEKLIAVVVNNNQPGTQHIIETAPNVTLDVGTQLYASPSVPSSAALNPQNDWCTGCGPHRCEVPCYRRTAPAARLMTDAELDDLFASRATKKHGLRAVYEAGRTASATERTVPQWIHDEYVLVRRADRTTEGQ